MDLESRMREKIDGLIIGKRMICEPEQLVKQLSKIAGEYAIEMCKKQRQMCVNSYRRRFDNHNAIGDILDTPLATEAQDEK